MGDFFCDECGARFKAIPSKCSGAVECPRGCGWCCFPDTGEGRAQSVASLIEYENAIEF